MRIAARRERMTIWAAPARALFWVALLASGTAVGVLLTGVTRFLLGS